MKKLLLILGVVASFNSFAYDKANFSADMNIVGSIIWNGGDCYHKIQTGIMLQEAVMYLANNPQDLEAALNGLPTATQAAVYSDHLVVFQILNSALDAHSFSPADFNATYCPSDDIRNATKTQYSEDFNTEASLFSGK